MKRITKQLNPVDMNALLPDSCCEEQDKVFLENIWFNDILGKPFKEFHYLPWKRPVIKITAAGNGKKRSIIRIVESGNSKGIKGDDLGLFRRDMSLLAVTIGTPVTCTVSKASKLAFFRKHPSHSVRIPFKVSLFLGSISVILGVVGILLNVL
jgi:hypothetical protein